MSEANVTKINDEWSVHVLDSSNHVLKSKKENIDAKGNPIERGDDINKDYKIVGYYSNTYEALHAYVKRGLDFGGDVAEVVDKVNAAIIDLKQTFGKK